MSQLPYQSHRLSFSYVGRAVTAPILSAQPQGERGEPARIAGPISTRFGHRLRQLRLARKWTQTQLADFLGIDRSFISDLERGRKSISLSYLETIAQGFDLKLEQLLIDI